MCHGVPLERVESLVEGRRTHGDSDGARGGSLGPEALAATWREGQKPWYGGWTDSWSGLADLPPGEAWRPEPTQWLWYPQWRLSARAGRLQTLVPGDRAGGCWARALLSWKPGGSSVGCLGAAPQPLRPQSSRQQAASHPHLEGALGAGTSLPPWLAVGCVWPRRLGLVSPGCPEPAEAVGARVAGKNRALGAEPRGMEPWPATCTPLCRSTQGHVWCGRLHVSQTLPAGAWVASHFPELLMGTAWLQGE